MAGQTTGGAVTDVYLDCIHVKTRTSDWCGQVCVSGTGYQYGGREGAPGPVDRPNRRGQVPAIGDHGAQEPGCGRHFIACVDELKGFPEAIEALYPQTAVQLCMVHMARHSLNHVIWKMCKAVAVDLKAVYNAATADEAALRLAEFDDQCAQDYPTIVKSWHSNWLRIVPFFE